MQQAVTQQVDTAQRATMLKIVSTEYETVTSEGKAVLMGFTNNYKTMVFMATRDLTNDVTLMASDEMKGEVVNGMFKSSGAVDYQFVTINGNAFIKITMPIRLQGRNLTSAKQLQMLTDEQAVRMANTLQGQDDKAVEKEREGTVILKPRRK